jgi:outer membrane protein assembly factor BamB
VAGDRVLAEASSKAPDLDAADSTVVGLDAATGQQLWSLADRYTRSEVAFVAGDVALVYARTAGTDTERDVAIMIDVSSGAEITRLGWDRGARTTCATDTSTVIACTLDEKLGEHPGDSNRLIIFDVPTRKSHPAPAKDLAETEVVAVWGDYIFVRDGHLTWAVDRNGTRVSDDLPGDLIGMDDRHMVVRLPGRTPVPAAYAVR